MGCDSWRVDAESIMKAKWSSFPIERRDLGRALSSEYAGPGDCSRAPTNARPESVEGKNRAFVMSRTLGERVVAENSEYGCGGVVCEMVKAIPESAVSACWESARSSGERDAWNEVSRGGRNEAKSLKSLNERSGEEEAPLRIRTICDAPSQT